MRYVAYEQNDHVVTIRMNRPERRNSMCHDMMEDLADAWDRFAADDTAWVAVLTGTGSAFCAGQDLKEAKERGRAGGTYRLARPYVGQTNKPIVTAVNGFAFGGGVVMALAGDLRVVAEDAHLQMTEIRLGLLGGWALGIEQRIPTAIQSEVSLLGAPLTGRRAYDLGLFNRCVPREQVLPTALELAEELCSLPPRATRMMKELLKLEQPRGSEAGWAFYEKTRPELAVAEDTLEAIRAFNEKRKPHFTGR